MVALTAFISPYRADRDQVRALMQPGDFVEVHVDCPIDVCEQGDVKGLTPQSSEQRYIVPVLVSVGTTAPETKPPLDTQAWRALVETSGRDATQVQGAFTEALRQ